jgi:hypothetical protein
MAQWGHQSIMKLLLEGSISSEMETAALELSTKLWFNSQGRSAIANSHDNVPCVQHALHALGELSVEEDRNADDASTVDAASYEDESEPPDSAEDVPTLHHEGNTDVKVEPSSSIELKCAALSFLSNMATVQQCRQEMVKSNRFIPSLSDMSKQCTEANLHDQTIYLIAALVPFATASTGSLAVDTLAQCLVNTMTCSSPTATKSDASHALMTIIYNVSPQRQATAVESVVKNFIAGVKRTTIARSTEMESEKSSLAQLMFSFAKPAML